MLEIKNLNKKISKDFQLKDVNLKLEEGYILALVGANGAGKTTLLKCIMGLLNLDSGNIEIFKKTMKEDEVFIKNNIGYISDSINYNEEFKVKDYESLIKGFYKNFDLEKFRGYLTKFKIDRKKKIKTLSKGQEAKLMLAKVLSQRAKLLLLDEPTSGLDPRTRKEIIREFQEVIEEGNKSIIISTHIISDLENVADYIVFMDEGRIIFNEDIESLMNSYKVVKGSKEEIESLKINTMFKEEGRYFSSALIKFDENLKEDLEGLNIEKPSLETIINFYLGGSHGFTN